MEQIPLYHGGNGDLTSSHNGSSISGDSEVSSVYTCFPCGMDGLISRFCSQMQSLADHGPNNNILYPHGPPLLVNRDSHEQSAQALTHGHHVDKKDISFTQPNRMRNRFRAYPEVTSYKDISSEEFTPKTPGRLPMTAGWAQQGQLKWLWSRCRADEPCQCDQMSNDQMAHETMAVWSNFRLTPTPRYSILWHS